MQPATRRRTILILGGIGATSLRAQTAKPGTTIHQEVDYKASPARVYEALLDQKQFAALTGSSAVIDRNPGGAFKTFGGRIEGRTIEMVPNRRLVQAWREESWPAGLYSLVKFELVAQGSGTRIVFDHTGILEEDFGHLNEGWPIRYWEPMRKYLGG
jgi:activator of HSP90 ATPase